MLCNARHLTSAPRVDGLLQAAARGWVVGVCVLVGLGVSVPGPLRAQQHPALPAPGGPALPPALPPALATITTDTGAFAPGHTSFTRYTTPGFCLTAVHHTIYLLRRSLAAQAALDVVRRDAMHDTLPAGVAPVARACAAAFTVAGTPVPELANLFQLALFAQADSLAEAVLARRFALAPTSGARVALLGEALETYLRAEPARVPAAEAILARLDALGQSPAVLTARLQGHQRLQQLADSMLDAPRSAHEAQQVITLWRTLPAEVMRADANVGALLEAYRGLLALAFFHAPDSLPSVVQHLQADVRRMGPTAPYAGYATMPVEKMLTHLSPVAGMDDVGHLTPALHAPFWFPGAAPPADTVQPVRGRVALFVEIPWHCYTGYAERPGAGLFDPVWRRCSRITTLLRQWQAQYGSAGLDITLVAWVADGYGTVLSGPQTPAEAARNLQWYFLQYLHLPVGRVAVQTIPVTEPLPGLDGRVFFQAPYGWLREEAVQQTPFDLVYHAGAYRNGEDPGLVLTGRDGRELYAGAPTLSFEQVLARAMTASVTPPSSAAAVPPFPSFPAAPSATAAHP